MFTSFTLNPTSPFRLDYTVWALRRRATNIVDRWDNNRYVRLFSIENQLIKVSVEQKNKKEILVSTNEKIKKATLIKLTRLLKSILGLNRALQDFYRIANQDPHLAPLAILFKGLKPPRFPSMFEALINAISCQQLSLDAGLQIQNRFIKSFGRSLVDNEGTYYAFPIPQDVTACSVKALKELGFSTNKSKSIIDLASKLSSDETLFENLENESNDNIVKFLCQLKGIGRWSAEYVLLRGLGKIEMFPGDDVGAGNNLKSLLQIETELDYHKISEITKKWYPYAGFIYFHLLLQKLSSKGFF